MTEIISKDEFSPIWTRVLSYISSHYENEILKICKDNNIFYPPKTFTSLRGSPNDYGILNSINLLLKDRGARDRTISKLEELLNKKCESCSFIDRAPTDYPCSNCRYLHIED